MIHIITEASLTTKVSPEDVVSKYSLAQLQLAGYVRFYAGSMNQFIYRVSPEIVEEVYEKERDLTGSEFQDYLNSLPPGMMFKTA